MKIAIGLMMLAAMCCAGCGTSSKLYAPMANVFQNGLFEEARARELEKKFTDQDIVDLLDLDVKAKLPTKLAIVKLQNHVYDQQFTRAEITSDELSVWKGIVDKHDAIKGISPVTDVVLEGSGPTLHALRVAAARMRCELLLVYVQADSTVDNYNDLALLYWSVVGMWLVPGNELQHRTAMHAILIDCRTGAVLGTAIGDAQKKGLAALATREVCRNKLALSAPKAALEDLQKSVADLVEGVLEAVQKRNVKTAAKAAAKAAVR